MSAFEFIETHRDEFRLDVMCRMLRGTKSGYFTWRGRPTSMRKTRDAKLKDEIRRSHARSKGRYGVPRAHAELRAAGRSCSHRRVARLMREAGLPGKVRRKSRSTTQADPVHLPAEDLVRRNFEVTAPNTVWASDMSYLRTKEGCLYMAVVLDLHSRLVVGCPVKERLTTDLPLAALHMALDRRRPPPGLIYHSDRGSQYTSRIYRDALEAQGALCSVGKKGDCFDNAVVESFFSTLRRKLVLDHVFRTRQEGRLQVFEYVEVFYNRQRRHSTLGYRTPVEFEQVGKHQAA